MEEEKKNFIKCIARDDSQSKNTKAGRYFLLVYAYILFRNTLIKF